MKELARITEQFAESAIGEMTLICDEVGGYNLSQGFPDFPAPDLIKQAAIAAIKADKNQYPVTFGELELRQEISKKAKRYNHLECDPETEITVTCGATEAMIATLKALINPGDEIIIFEPFYENYGPGGILSGAIPRYVQLQSPNWTYSSEALASAFNEKTKAIIINTPNNPTGKVFNKKELVEIAELCQQWDVYAITDEIYEHILYDGVQHISLATLPGMKERTITINSISKTYSVTGWRIGWTIAAAPITQRIRKIHDYLTVGAPTPFQHASAKALQMLDPYYQQQQEYYAQARTFLYDSLFEVGFNPVLPQGAYYMMADVSELMHKWGLSDSFSFSKQLIERVGVATVPGTSFYASSGQGITEVRFCFCKHWDTLRAVQQALLRLKND